MRSQFIKFLARLLNVNLETLIHPKEVIVNPSEVKPIRIESTGVFKEDTVYSTIVSELGKSILLQILKNNIFSIEHKADNLLNPDREDLYKMEVILIPPFTNSLNKKDVK